MSLKLENDAIENLLKRHGFYLLISPTGPVEVGSIWEGSTDAIDLAPVDELSMFVKAKNIVPRPIYLYPTVTRGASVPSYSGMIKKITGVNIAVEFFKGIFSRIAKTLGFKASGGYASKKIEAIYYNFITNTSDTMLRNSVTRSLENFIIDRDIWRDGKRYFVVTGVYRTSNMQMLFVNGEDTDIKAAVEAAKLASVDFSYKKSRQGMELIFHKMEPPIPFGVQFGELIYDYKEEKFFVTDYTTQPNRSSMLGAGTSRYRSGSYNIQRYQESNLNTRYRSKKIILQKSSTEKKFKVKNAKIGPKNNTAVRLLSKKYKVRSKQTKLVAG